MRHAGWIAIAAALLLTGCGMKGPLYLPEKNAQVVTTPAAAAPAATPPASEAPAQPNPTPRKRDDKDQDSPPPPE